MNVFYFFRGLYRNSKKHSLIFLNTNFNVIAIALLALAFWHPLQAVGIFVLLFIITITGAPIRIHPLSFKNLCKWCWIWLCFLMEFPSEENSQQ
jgi:hypothetical protein